MTRRHSGMDFIPKKPKIRILTALIVTAVSCAIAYLVMVPLSESILAKLFSAPETSDFTMSDMFIQFADARPIRHIDDRIVLVDIGYANREGIAEALEIISASQPKAVGLDVNFPNPKDESDSYLMEALEMQNILVLPLGVEKEGEYFKVDDVPFFYDSLKSENIHYGVVNLPAKSSRSSIREFEIEFPLSPDSVIPSYVVELIKVTDPQKYNLLKKRSQERETIDYASREFNILPIDQLIENTEMLAGKYVLVGALGDAYDMHATPLNSNMAGLMIHANSLATILDGVWYKYIPDLVDYIVSVILCFLLVFASESLPGKGKDFVLHAIQLFILVMAVWIGYTLFIDNRTIIDLTFTFFAVGLGLMVLDFGHGLMHLYAWIKKKLHQSKLKKQNN